MRLPGVSLKGLPRLHTHFGRQELIPTPILQMRMLRPRRGNVFAQVTWQVYVWPFNQGPRDLRGERNNHEPLRSVAAILPGSLLRPFRGSFCSTMSCLKYGLWAHFREKENEARKRGCHIRWSQDLNAVQFRRSSVFPCEARVMRG